MSNSALASRATAVRNHIWDGDRFRPLKPTAPFQPQPSFREDSSTSLLLQLHYNGPKLLPRTEVQWILTPTGVVIERILARMSPYILGSWETLISSIDEGELTEILPNPGAVVALTPYPTEAVACQEVMEEEKEEEEQNSKGSTVSLGPKEFPVFVKLKAKSVTDISRDWQTSSTSRTVQHQNRLRAGHLTYPPESTAEECLRKMLVNNS
ncbi:hypothetical protein L211DRAFT_850362 [Terfezia boudieri ATCC MYA-4762]|uniref:Uncharacterized protein n=1 Tax=Terfezia boudieri ATCC MYA-4762 TaxID=1051890 RepID=A0A3N4LY32_9PEZI|nr:hypothetical protein L211DRAFT_850362 [Terfezia boudieri ATCC MYA-4762]